MDDTCDLQRLSTMRDSAKYQASVCLVWASPETKQRIAGLVGGVCYSLSNIIEDIEPLEKKVYEFVREICDEGRKYRGLSWRRYLLEELFRDCLYPESFLSALIFLKNLRAEMNVEHLEVDLLVSQEHLELLNRFKSKSKINEYLVITDHPERLRISQRKPSRKL